MGTAAGEGGVEWPTTGLGSVSGEGFPTHGGCCQWDDAPMTDDNGNSRADARRKKKEKKKKFESDGSEGTGWFGGPIVGSTGSILAQPLYGPKGRTGSEW